MALRRLPICKSSILVKFLLPIGIFAEVRSPHRVMFYTLFHFVLPLPTCSLLIDGHSKSDSIHESLKQASSLVFRPFKKRKQPHSTIFTPPSLPTKYNPSHSFTSPSLLPPLVILSTPLTSLAAPVPSSRTLNTLRAL